MRSKVFIFSLIMAIGAFTAYNGLACADAPALFSDLQSQGVLVAAMEPAEMDQVRAKATYYLNMSAPTLNWWYYFKRADTGAFHQDAWGTKVLGVANVVQTGNTRYDYCYDAQRGEMLFYFDKALPAISNNVTAVQTNRVVFWPGNSSLYHYTNGGQHGIVKLVGGGTWGGYGHINDNGWGTRSLTVWPSQLY